MRFDSAKWKRAAGVLIALLVVGFLNPAGGAPGAPTSPEAKTSEPAKGEPKADTKGQVPVLMTIQDYSPIAVASSRFQIKNVNFDRRYAPTGLGEFLDVVFDMDNLTGGPLDLYAYIIAVAETDAVDASYREVIPYPAWRKHDPLSERYLVRYLTLTGRDGLKADEIAGQIWDASDPDFRWARYRVAAMRTSAAVQKPIEDVLPPMWKYQNYFFFNPENGLKFKLHGELGPLEADAIQTNFIRPTAKEQETRIFNNIDKHTYTLEHSRRRTIFRSHHYSQFRPNYRFFNKVIIMVFEQGPADAFRKDMAALLPRKRELQNKRLDLDQKLIKAESSEDETALSQLASENLNLRREEEKMGEEVRALVNKHNHLAFKKTYSLAELKVF